MKAEPTVEERLVAIEQRLDEAEQRVTNAETTVAQQGELHTDMRALLRATGKLHTTVEDAVKSMNARGWTPTQTRLMTGAALVIAGAEVGARLGLW